jgi:TRAP-type transport system periplasmic protein
LEANSVKARIRTRRRNFMVGSVCALATVGFINAPSLAAQFEFKCSANNALDHPITIRLTQMWKAIQEESGGRVHVQFFPNSQLGSDPATFAQLRLGAIQFSSATAALLSGVVPGADISFLGFAFKDPDEGLRVMNGSLGAYVRQEAEVRGIHVLRTSWDTGMIEISSGTHPIQTPDDMHAFKLRVVESRATVDLFKDLGAIPTPLSVNQIYTSLQSKLIDGCATTVVTFEASRWYEVQKYMSLTNHSWGQVLLIANGDAWKSLPSDLQELIERNHTKYAELEQRDAKISYTALIDKLTRQGITFNKVDQGPFRERLQSYYEFWAREYGARAWDLLERSLGHKLA